MGRDPNNGTPCCLCIPGQPRYSLYVCFADSTTSYSAYFVSIFVTMLIIVSCITFTLETLPQFRIEAEVFGRPNAVFDAIEAFAIAVFTIEYFSRLLTYSAVPREEDADSKLLLFEARMLERRALGVADDEESAAESSDRSQDGAASRDGLLQQRARPPNRLGFHADDAKLGGLGGDDGPTDLLALPAGRHRAATMPGPALAAGEPSPPIVATRRRGQGHTSRVASAARVARGKAGAVADAQGRRSSLAGAGALVRQQGGAEAVKQARAGASRLASLRPASMQRPAPASGLGSPAGRVPPTEGPSAGAAEAMGASRSFAETDAEAAMPGPAPAHLRVTGHGSLAARSLAAPQRLSQPSTDPASSGPTAALPGALPAPVPSTEGASASGVGSSGAGAGRGLPALPLPASALARTGRRPAHTDASEAPTPAHDVTAASDQPTGGQRPAKQDARRPGSGQVNASAAAAAAGGVPAKAGSEGSSPPRAGARSEERPSVVGQHTGVDGAVELRPVTSTRSTGRVPARTAASPSASAALHRDAPNARHRTGPASEGRRRAGEQGFRTGAAEVAARQLSERTIDNSLNHSGSVPFQSVGGMPANDLPTPSRGSGLHRGVEDAPEMGQSPEGAFGGEGEPAGPTADDSLAVRSLQQRGGPPPLLLQRSGPARRPTTDAEATAAVEAAMAGLAGVSPGADGDVDGDGESLSTRHEGAHRGARTGSHAAGESLSRGAQASGARPGPPLQLAGGIGQSMASVLEAAGGDAVGTLPFAGANPGTAARRGEARGAAAGGSAPGQNGIHPDAAALLAAGGVTFDSKTGPLAGRPDRGSVSTASRPRSRDGSGSGGRLSRDGGEKGKGGLGLGGGTKFASWTSQTNSGGKAASGRLRQTKSGKEFASKLTRGRSRRVAVQELGNVGAPGARARSTRYIKPSKSVRMLSGSLQPGQITEFRQMRMQSATDGGPQAPVESVGSRSEALAGVGGVAGKATVGSGSSASPAVGFRDGKAIVPGKSAAIADGGKPVTVTASAAAGSGALVDGPRRRAGNHMSSFSGARVAPAPARGSAPSDASQALRPFSGQGPRRQSELDMEDLFRKGQRTRTRPELACFGLCAWLPFCGSSSLTQFDSTWSLDEQAMAQEQRQLKELHTRAASDSFSRVIGHELLRAWEFVVKPLNVVDLLAIIPFYIGLLAAGTGGGGLTVFRILRLGRVFRIFKLGKSSGTLQLMAKVMLASADALSIIVFFILIGVILFGSLIWIAEGGEYSESLGYFVRPDEFGVGTERTPFDSIPATAWFVVVTVTTTGFGDQTPNTWLGKLIAGILAHVGILVLALPVTILGANFAYYYAEDEKEKEEAERERIRAEEGFEDDLSDVYSQAGALDEVEVRGISVGGAYDADDDPTAPPMPVSGDDVPKYEQRHAAFYVVQPGGYVPALRTFIYNPFIKDDTFADGIAEALTGEVDRRVRDLHLDAATKVLRQRMEGKAGAPGRPGAGVAGPGPAGIGRLPSEEARQLTEAKVVRRRSVAAKARRNRRRSSATEALQGAGKTLGGLGRKSHIIQQEQAASRAPPASAVATHTANRRMSAGPLLNGASAASAAAQASAAMLAPMMVATMPIAETSPGFTPPSVDVAAASGASAQMPHASPGRRLHLAAPRRASVSGGASGAAVGRMVSQRRLSNAHSTRPGERLSLLQRPHLDAAAALVSSAAPGSPGGAASHPSEDEDDDVSAGEAEDRVGFGFNDRVSPHGDGAVGLRLRSRTGSGSPRGRDHRALVSGARPLRASRGHGSGADGGAGSGPGPRNLYARVAAQHAELGAAAAAARNRGGGHGSKRLLSADSGTEADADAEFLGMLAGTGGGGTGGRGTGAAAGMSWQLKQVARQVAREVRADGTAETIVAVRAEQSQLREALSQTQSDLASALQEIRDMAARMRDHQRARMIVARSSSVESRSRQRPAPPPRSGSARTADSLASGDSTGRRERVDVTQASISADVSGDAGMDSVARKLKEQLSARQLRELLANLEATEGAAAAST